MLIEIKREDAKSRLTDPSLYIMKLAEGPMGTVNARYELTKLMDYGTPTAILKALDGDNIRILEERTDE